MNKRGVALAADSAVTLGDGEKVYLTAEKLFQVSQSVPVGIMTYGAAEIMGVPWETVIKLYAQKLRQRSFDRLEQYVEDFLRFVEGSQALFSESLQRRFLRQSVGSYWYQFFLDPLNQRLEKKAEDRKRALAILAQLIEEDRQDTQANFEVLEDLGESHGERIIEEYAAELDGLEGEMFGSFKPTKEIRDALRDTVKLMFTRSLFGNDTSTLVFAGMGEAEAPPVLFQYSIGTVVAGKLRFAKADQATVDEDTPAVVVPMAQRQVIDMFYGGIAPELRPKLLEIVGNVLLKKSIGRSSESAPRRLKRFEDDFYKELDRVIAKSYTDPLISAVAGLPRNELAGLAEALVSITVFVAKMQAGKKETVGGPIDVALISKGDGFVWIKRKESARGFALGYPVEMA